MPDRHLYWVTLATKNRVQEERIFRFVFECGLPSVEALAGEMREFGCVSGQRLRLVNDPEGNRVVAEREDFLFGVHMVGSVQPYQHRVLGLDASRDASEASPPVAPAGRVIRPGIQSDARPAADAEAKR